MTHAFLVTIDTDDETREPIADAKEIASAIIDAIERSKIDRRAPSDEDIEVRYLGCN